ncbi:GDSL-type esterase/lipase family protein [Chitinophaga sp. GbtcB8]|uniref:GDSL-type esterase/lipase family protein n=1 Tax=Chitinophaga sp. GbtcB8 TaxID=2824753 RepID=UPI001C30B023|nr:GDSL-type esterase/lipase family protein [Chitinophaga sp. GbtcB8]
MPDNHSNNKPVSEELIRQYLAGELDDKAMHALERQALNDPFLTDALEGYAAHGPDQSAHLADLENRLEQRVNSDKGKVRIMYYRWASAAAILLILGLSFIWINHQELNHRKDIAKVSTTENAIPSVQDSIAQPATQASEPAVKPGTIPPSLPAVASAPAKDVVQPSAPALKVEKASDAAIRSAEAEAPAEDALVQAAPAAPRIMMADTTADAKKDAYNNFSQQKANGNANEAKGFARVNRNQAMVAQERTPDEKLRAKMMMAPVARHIVVLGSSTAEGVGPKTKDSTWVNLLRKYLQEKAPQSTVTNLAVGGFTSYRILPSDADVPFLKPKPDAAHNITQALALQPDMIIINMPSNDINVGYSLKEYQRNLDAVMKLARQQHVTCYITTTQPRNTGAAKRKQLITMRDYIIRHYPHNYIDCWEGLSAPDGSLLPQYNSGDGVHLNGLGHQLMFERIKAKVN